MVSFVEVWTRSLELWLAELHKAILRNRKKGLLNFLTVLSHSKGFLAFAQALIHCRGDRDDPLVSLLLMLSKLSRKQIIDASFAKLLTHRSMSNLFEEEAHLRKHKNAVTVSIISRSILAALTPTILHVFLSRRGNSLESQHNCHCYSAILEDVRKVVKAEDLTSCPVFFRPSRRSLSRNHRKAHQSLFNVFHAEKLDRAIFNLSFGKRFFWQVHPKDNEEVETLVQAVKDSDTSKECPIDNTSGLFEVLVAISRLYKPKEFGSVPYSLFNFYEELPASHPVIKSRVENALVYIQRLRSLDLEFKNGRTHMLKEAAKSNEELLQTMRSRMLPRTTSTKLKRDRRLQYRRNDTIRGLASSSNYLLPPNAEGALLGANDSALSSVVSSCLLFFSVNVSGFLKICSAIRNNGHHKVRTVLRRLLVFAAEAMILSEGGVVSAGEPPVTLKPPAMVYYTFMGVLEAICSNEVIDITPSTLILSKDTATRWINDDIVHSVSNSEGRERRSLESGNVASSNGSVCNNLSKDQLIANLKGMVLQDGKVITHAFPLLSNRDALMKSVQCKIHKRVYMSENNVLHLIKAHATVFRLMFDHLVGAFCEIRQGFTSMYHEDKANFGKRVSEVFIGKHQLTAEDGRMSYNKLMQQYSLYAYTQLVFAKFTARMTHDMFLRAFWLSNNHMERLSSRLRIGINDTYL